ncbi:MAG: S8 family peptidase [Vicinamibacterales bacterium]
MNILASVRALHLWELIGSRRLDAARRRRALALLAILAMLVPSVAQAAGRRKLDPELSRRSVIRRGTSRVVVRLSPGATLPAGLRTYVRGTRLQLIDAYVLNLPDSMLSDLDDVPEIASAHQDRDAWAADYLSTKATGADVAQDVYDLTGRGIGVAVLDSGITSWHDDLTPDRGRARYPYGQQRVSKFVDFVNNQTMPYDDHGHGSHVAGIILGNGYDSNGRESGMAPDAALISLKVLDKEGKGSISTIISALDWVADNADIYNIRVVNLSLGAAVTQSYWVDPLALAARRLTERGIVVVSAAGNLGKNAKGERQYGGIIAPGNAPWVLTVGASSTEGTARTQDDVLASFSSLGPTRGDYLAKPDLLAPGRGVLSLAVPGSTLYQGNQDYLSYGSRKTGYPPYLSLSGTSMATPQVSGAVALMLQANPNLTPNLVKAILQYTAHENPDYSPLQEGAGFLDVLGAVRLSKFYAANRPGSRMPVERSWSQHIVWGNHELSGGYINPLANAWSTKVVWGAAMDNIVWGVHYDAENIVWGTMCSTDNCSNIVWGVGDARGTNIVWGVNDNAVWGTTTADNIVWGVSSLENIVWGVSAGESDNIVWGVACGGDNCANIVWGVQTADNIVWGVVSPNENIVWGVADNIVWGVLDSSGNIVWGVANVNDNIVWGVADNGNIVWGVADSSNIVWGVSSADNIVWGVADNIVWGVADTDNILWSSAAGEGH